MNDPGREAQMAVERATKEAVSLTEFGQGMAQSMTNHIAFDRFNIGLINIERYEFEDAFVTGRNVTGRSTGHRRALTGSVVDAAIQAGDGFYFGHTNRDEWLQRFPGFGLELDSGIRAMLAVPLRSDGQVFASLVFAACDPDAYGEQSLAVAIAVGRNVTQRIHKLR